MVKIHIKVDFRHNLKYQENDPLTELISNELRRRIKEIQADEAKKKFFFLERFKEIEITLTDDEKSMNSAYAVYIPRSDYHNSDVAKIAFNCVQIWNTYIKRNKEDVAFLIQEEILSDLYHEFTHATRFLVNKHVHEVFSKARVEKEHLDECFDKKNFGKLGERLKEFFIASFDRFFLLIVEEGFTTLSESKKFEEIFSGNLQHTRKQLKIIRGHAVRKARMISDKIKKFYKEFDEICASKDIDKMQEFVEEEWLFMDQTKIEEAEYAIGLHILLEVLAKSKKSYKKLLHMHHIDFLHEYDKIAPKFSKSITCLHHKLFSRAFLKYHSIKKMFTQRIDEFEKDLLHS